MCGWGLVSVRATFARMSTEHDGSDGLREIGDCGVWTLSSAKPGFGVHQLRDGNINTYWQSDGSQPHTVSIAFPKKVTTRVCVRGSSLSRPQDGRVAR